MFLRPPREAGSEGWSRPDISGPGAFGTENGTWGAFAGDVCLRLGGWLETQAGAGRGRADRDFYVAGLNLPLLDRGVCYSLQFAGAVAQASWQLAPKSSWWLGLRDVHADAELALRDDAILPGLAGAVRMKVSAPSAIVAYDSRNNVFTPTAKVPTSATTQPRATIWPPDTLARRGAARALSRHRHRAVRHRRALHLERHVAASDGLHDGKAEAPSAGAGAAVSRAPNARSRQ